MGKILISQMVHCSLVKMTNQMVHILLIKKTTLVTMDMSKLTCPKWSNGFFYAYPNWVFFSRFIGKKNQNFY
jgi:hypothetical protein